MPTDVSTLLLVYRCVYFIFTCFIFLIPIRYYSFSEYVLVIFRLSSQNAGLFKLSGIETHGSETKQSADVSQMVWEGHIIAID